MGTRLLVWCILPAVWLWARRMERKALRQGRPLKKSEIGWARQAGVQEPERIRLVEVDEMPRPTFRWMHGVAARWGLSLRDTLGLCLRYGIYIRRGSCDRWGTLVHECCHTAQCERLGGLGAFLSRYLVECLGKGYEDAPLEVEARQGVARLREVCRAQDGCGC